MPQSPRASQARAHMPALPAKTQSYKQPNTAGMHVHYLVSGPGFMVTAPLLKLAVWLVGACTRLDGENVDSMPVRSGLPYVSSQSDKLDTWPRST